MVTSGLGVVKKTALLVMVGHGYVGCVAMIAWGLPRLSGDFGTT